MIILAIETSCDDTAISIVSAKGGLRNPSFKILSQVVSSQTKVHAHWGGVVPSLAKREHGKNLVPVLNKALRQVQGKTKAQKRFSHPNEKTLGLIKKLLVREPELLPLCIKFITENTPPKIDLIAVTKGPGLEPALWTGISFAKALSLVWNKPLIPINHMEGHAISPLLNAKQKITFPALALLVSGGHTELVLVHDFNKYKILGATRDDAVGEAFDKVARILGLPYPGGPEISRLAKKFKAKVNPYPLPRPMINSNDFDFSFSGLKTAVLYTFQKIKNPTDADKIAIANEFEKSAVEVLVKKTMKAVEKYKVKSIIVGGGVSANELLRNNLKKEIRKISTKIKLFLPSKQLATDNATMIAMAGYIRFLSGSKPKKSISAEGNLPLGKV